MSGSVRQCPASNHGFMQNHKTPTSLTAAKILVVGAGGLGSTVCIALAQSGLGHLGLIDYDQVEISNLNRQILHNTSDIDRLKVDSAAEKIGVINPGLDLKIYPHKLDAQNAIELFSPYHLVIDCCDSLEIKFLLNDAAFLSNTPLIHCGVVAFTGQMLTIIPGISACYRCIFPEIPPEGVVLKPAEIGVLGPMPGILGALQVIEAIKYLSGVEHASMLSNRLLIFQGLEDQIRTIPIKRNPLCPLCGDQKNITQLDDENYGHL